MIEIQKVDRIEKPGAYRVAEDVYHADPAPQPSLSSSAARLMLETTPLHVWTSHPRLNPDWHPGGETRNKTFGALCHRLLLDEGADVIEIPADDFRTKIAQQARDAAYAEGKIPALTKDIEKATAIAEAAREQLDARGLREIGRGGDSEVSIFSEHETGAWMRARLDYWSGCRTIAVDYKTTVSLASANAFARTVAQQGYDVQNAFYDRAIELAFPALAGRVRFLFVVQEIEPPFALNVLQLCEADVSVARRKVELAVDLWNVCRRENRWPAYPTQIQRVTLPVYANAAFLERELDGEDDPMWRHIADSSR